MKVVCIEEEAFFELFERVVARIEEGRQSHSKMEWISSEKAMALLSISSKTTLQKYRDEGRIRFSQLSRKVILYSRSSILEMLEENIQKF